jgi:hypothetical protein
MSTKSTQKKRVLDAMKGHHTKSISTWYAFNSLGNTRLAATIFELKKDGHEITSITEKSKNKFGDDVRYSRYILVKEKVLD